jgi:predicted helicase
MSLHSIHNYHLELEKIIHFGGTKKETAIRNAFYNLLNEYAKQKGLMLIPEITIKTARGKNVTPDGTIKDMLRLDWGYWESKDEADDINEEIKKKFAKDYPKDNIIFEDSNTAVLFQNGVEQERANMKDEKALDHILTKFINYERPEVKNFRTAIELFKQDIPKVTATLHDLIDKQETTNPKYLKERDKFLKLCQDSINPDVTKEDVREMLIQHILTEDIFNTIFDETQFHRENNIAHQLEGVLNTFFIGATRKNTLGTMQHYYQAINATGAGIADHHEKQKFLKVVYEIFYKSYNPKAADRLGVVYTPNEIVRFMIESTDYLLHKHFGKYLQDKGVEILDPATGTGTFVCDMIDYIQKEKLEYKYKNEIHANEVAILPYYISNLNVEFTYKQKMGEYAEFENLCFVDTLDNMGFAYRGKQQDLFAPFTEENSKRIKNQNNKKIAVVIGNPPYNANQQNENDNNKNREYREIDKRIKDTFIKYSTAQKTKVYDMYARFYRWAFDRLDNNGVIAFVTNRSFIDSRTFDGFRKCVQDEFDYAYIIDTKSDVRANPKISGTGHNVFGIQTGVAIMFLVKKLKRDNVKCKIQYVTLDDFWRKEQKLQWFTENPLKQIAFENVTPDKNSNWINISNNDFDSLLPIADKIVKAGNSKKALFELFSNGIVTARDAWTYDFNRTDLKNKITFFSKAYADDKLKWANSNKTEKTNDFVDRTIKWTGELEIHLKKGTNLIFNENHIKQALYRPFVKQFLYFDRVIIHRLYQQDNIFPIGKNLPNRLIGFSSGSARVPFCVITTDSIPDYAIYSLDSAQFLPLYRYDENGNQIENITDWGLNQFTKQYGTKKIKKEDIFHYVYAVLHNPSYRKKYELNLKREFPRIPFYTDFFKWAKWGKQLMEIHINYETAKPFTLKQTTTDELTEPKAKLKAVKEKGEIIIDDNTLLSGIPKEAWEYKLGNRSALEWVLDQYKESKPKDPTIAEKFNTYRFAEYKDEVIDLLKKVCTVSVETIKIITEIEKENN